jgi:cytochrome b6-f complex iron-sulfur subunit
LNETLSVSRRRFIRNLTMLGAAAVAAPMLGHAAQAQAPTMLPAGKESDFVVGDYKKVSLSNGNTVFVERTSSGYRALVSACTHRGCTVNWLTAQKQFRCPCHGGLFDETGKNVAGPPQTPLPTLATKVTNGIVYVQQ